MAAKTKKDPEQLAIEALSRALTDGTPRILIGTAKNPGFFTGAAAKPAAELCLSRGWLRSAGQARSGKGKKTVEVYEITPAGVAHTLAHAETSTLLKDCADSLRQTATELQALRGRADAALAVGQKQQDLLTQLRERLQPPNLDGLLQRLPAPARSPGRAAEWPARGLAYLGDYRRRHPYGHCPLPELFRQTAEPLGLSIGQFHDGLRELVQAGQVRLHPFTGAAYQLQDEHYALVAGQEIKYYAERLA